MYTDLLVGEGDTVVLPSTSPWAESVFHLYVIQVADRDRLRAQLEERCISTVIHYPIPIHLQPAYANLRHRRGDFPIAEGLADRVLSLPMYAELREGDIEFVAQAVKAFAHEEPRS
jgi:dTDP-4-amino-4,6-dideoxygalactose transaminase